MVYSFFKSSTSSLYETVLRALEFWKWKFLELEERLKDEIRLRRNSFNLSSCKPLRTKKIIFVITLHFQDTTCSSVIEVIHVRLLPLDTQTMECVEYNRVLSLEQNLAQHFPGCVEPREKKFRAGSTYECALCEKSYDRRQNLVRHMHVHQPPESEYRQRLLNNNYECAVCGRTYNRRHNLIRHIRIHKCVLPSTGSIDMIKKNHCNECEKTFRSFSGLKRHLKNVHQQSSSKAITNDRLRCVLCGMNFRRKDDVQHHLISSHDVLLVHEHFCFLSMEEFQSWKVNMEKSTTSVFVKIRCHSGDDTNIWWYICHRSGCYQPRVENRHRRIKLQGSMKIGGYCPAAITLFENKRTGRCKASYVSTHLGHNTCDEAELAHMYLTVEEKEQLAEKIVEGVSYNRILTDNVDVAEEDPSMDPLYLLNKQSLFNISSTFRIKAPAAPVELKPYSVEAFVVEYHQSILFLKRAGEKHPTETALDVNDTIAIVMTQVQEELFRKFGNSVVTADGTFSINHQDLVFHALSIVDNWYEATPVALAISSRNDQIFTDLFVRTVRQRVGKMMPITFMSEMGTTYYESWRLIMGPVQFQLFCRWHVENAWRQNARKITQPERRNEVLRCLLSVSMCLDENQFLLDWKTLLADEDPKVQSFMQYLKTTFAKNVKSWAYCYRANAGLNNNFHLKAFDRCMKYFNSNLLKEATFTEFLSLLNDFLELETKDLTRKRIFGKLSSKLANLRKRHDIVAKEELTMVVDLVDDPFVGWLVSVCEGDDDSWSMYAVRPKREACDGCKMVCEGCASCLHLYECTCRDYCIEFNMCIHIHKVCLHLRESQQPSLDVESCAPPNNHSQLRQWSGENNDSPRNSVEFETENVDPLAYKQEALFDDEDEYECKLFEESLEAPNTVDASQIPFIELCKQIKTVEGEKVVRQIVRITEAELNAIDVSYL